MDRTGFLGLRWTFRRRLGAVVGLTVASLLAMVPADLITTGEVDRQLNSIESDYVPLLDLGPAVEGGFMELSRHLQEAVGAQDAEALAATRVEERQLLARLDVVPHVVNASAVQELRHGLDDWYATALGVSQRLAAGETGEPIVGAIQEMQAKQRRAEQEIRATIFLDRNRLQTAFWRVHRVHAVAMRIHIGIQIALALAVTALTLTMSKTVVATLSALIAGFDRFGRGQFDEPVVVIGHDELATVAQEANKMAARLAELNDQLRSRQADLERANRELEAFSYSVSHDLRAPLRSIDGFSLALLEDYAENLPEGGRHYLDRVRAAAQRMAQLIDDMLRLSRISRGELHPTHVDVSAMAVSVADELASADPQLHVDVSIQPGMAAEADAQLLRIVLENLLGNARKFASRVEHPHVEVGVSGDGAFFVRDNGAGFESEQATRLFVPFQRLHTTAEFPGTGIGLATVQRIVHRHGGRVWAEGAVGHGATFHFAIAREGAHA